MGIRTLLYTTNGIQSLNARFRAAIRRRGHFPTEQSTLKIRRPDPGEGHPNPFIRELSAPMESLGISFPTARNIEFFTDHVIGAVVIEGDSIVPRTHNLRELLRIDRSEDLGIADFYQAKPAVGRVHGPPSMLTGIPRKMRDPVEAQRRHTHTVFSQG